MCVVRASGGKEAERNDWRISPLADGRKEFFRIEIGILVAHVRTHASVIANA